MLSDQDYKRIEDQIASESSPVGIDAKKTHVMILSKLESIERRLEQLETKTGSAALPIHAQTVAENTLATATDTFDDTIERLRNRGVDVDERAHAAIGLLEKLSQPTVIEALTKITDRIESLEPLVEAASHAPGALAALTDTLDEEVAKAAANGSDIDAALRNGIAAAIYLGQRISSAELEALGTLLRSDVLHPSAVNIVGQLGRALVAAAESPTGSVGPVGAITKLNNQSTRRSTAFMLEFAKHFGEALTRNNAHKDKQSDGGNGNV